MLLVKPGTWSEAFPPHAPGVAEAHGAVRLRQGQQPLAEVVHPLVQVIRDVGRLQQHNHRTQSRGTPRLPETAGLSRSQDRIKDNQQQQEYSGNETNRKPERKNQNMRENGVHTPV